MLPNDKEYLVRKEHYQALQREAERARLVELVRLHRPRKEKIYQKLLGWIGGQLIRWGLKLQQDKQIQVNNITELAENTD